MRKGLFLAGMLVISLGLFAKEASARLCLVSHEADTAGNIFTLRYHVNMIGRAEDEAFCTAVTGTFDEWLFVNTTGTPAQREETLTQHQIIWFATRQLGGYPTGNPVDLIVLTSQLRFRNSTVRMIIGNQPRVMPEGSSYDYDYRDDYNPQTLLRRGYGLVTLDAHSLTGLAAATPLLCEDDSREVILRNIAVNTANLTKDQLFASAPCLRDGGAVYVCPNSRIDTAKQPNQEGWCREETTPPTEDCDDPGEDDEDGDGDANCDDSDCDDEEVCQQPTENCSTTDVDEDGDGLAACDDPDCDEEPACLDESLHCDDLLDNDGDSLGDCEDTEDCCSAANCSSLPQCQPPVVPEAGNCADDTDNDGDSLTDCLDTTDCCSDAACVAHEACQIVVTPEDCDDGVSNDDDALADCLDPDCAADAACVIIPPEVENCTNGADDDGDTKIDCLDTDCFVSDACQVVATETGYCSDSIDNDSDGSVDCTDSDCSSVATCQTTGGGDGVCGTIAVDDFLAVTGGRGRGRVAVANCADPDCAALPECQDTVCDDPDGCVDGPSETEAGFCTDRDDNDGNGALDCNDSNCASDTLCVCLFDPNCTVPNYSDDNIDDDGDGFTVNGGDCDDKSGATHPAATESCDELDNDCDGIADEVCQGEPDVDDDGDGFCESLVSCQTGEPGDCDDNNADMKPGATEICDDNMDNNCDGHEGSADDLEGIDLDSDDDSAGETTVPGVPALMRIARADGDDETPVVTIEGSGDETQPINPAIDLACEISVLEGDKGEGGGGCGCDLSGKKSSPQTAAVWFFLTMIPFAFVIRLRFAKV